MEEILELAKKRVDEAEVYRVTSEETPVTFEANRLKIMETKQTSGVALRIIKDGRVGLASTTDMSQLSSLVEMAVEMAQFGALAKFDFPTRSRYPKVRVYDQSVAKLRVERMVEIGQEVIDRVRAYDPQILCDVGVTKNIGTIEINNTRGGHAKLKKTDFGVGLAGNLVRGTDMLDVYESDSASALAVDHLALADRLTEKVELAKNLVSPVTKTMPVILTPKGAAGVLLQSLTMAFNGKLVLEGASPLSGKLSQETFDNRLSIFDDGTIDLRPSSRPFDDEGVAVRRTALVEEGVVRNFFYDLQTAGLAGRESTGNGFRGLGSLPSPAPTAFVFGEGEMKYDDMVTDVKEGIIVDQMMGAWAGNVLAGEFSGNIHLGYKIENGRIVGRVKDTVLSGNIFSALKDLIAIGAESVWVDGSAKLPALYFRGLSVASRG